MTEETKKQLLKIIDQESEIRDALTKLEDERRNSTKALDKKIQDKYNELNTLGEKKRVIMLADAETNQGPY